MSKKVYSTIAGLFRINHDRIVDSQPYKEVGDFLSAKGEKSFLQKHKLNTVSDEVCPKNKELFSDFAKANIKLTKQEIRNSIGKDQCISHSVNSLEDLDRAIHTLSRRLREWAGVYVPEVVHTISTNEKLARLLLTKDRKALLHEFRVHTTMGGSLEKQDIGALQDLARQIQALYHAKEGQRQYLEGILRKYAPNTLDLLGTELTAELIAIAGSLKKLSSMPSSTVQLLGAEKALFKHLTQKARCPRHGIIVKHPLLSGAKNKDHGKIARGLSQATSLCLRLDYFKGEKGSGKVLRKKLEKKFGCKP